MNAPWLFAEAYKYRRLRECFSLSKYFVEYGKLFYEWSVTKIRLISLSDVFFRQKCDTFSRSNQAVFELSQRFSEPQSIDANLSEQEQLEKKKLLFLELTQGECYIWETCSPLIDWTRTISLSVG